MCAVIRRECFAWIYFCYSAWTSIICLFCLFHWLCLKFREFSIRFLFARTVSLISMLLHFPGWDFPTFCCFIGSTTFTLERGECGKHWELTPTMKKALHLTDFEYFMYMGGFNYFMLGPHFNGINKFGELSELTKPNSPKIFTNLSGEALSFLYEFLHANYFEFCLLKLRVYRKDFRGNWFERVFGALWGVIWIKASGAPWEFKLQLLLLKITKACAIKLLWGLILPYIWQLMYQKI